VSALKTTARLLKARAELREWLADLSMLEKRTDVLDAHRKAWNDAWNVALVEGAKAAVEYVEAIGEASNNV
jgi:hypothetical protein